MVSAPVQRFSPRLPTSTTGPVWHCPCLFSTSSVSPPLVPGGFAQLVTAALDGCRCQPGKRRIQTLYQSVTDTRSPTLSRITSYYCKVCAKTWLLLSIFTTSQCVWECYCEGTMRGGGHWEPAIAGGRRGRRCRQLRRPTPHSWRQLNIQSLKKVVNDPFRRYFSTWSLTLLPKLE